MRNESDIEVESHVEGGQRKFRVAVIGGGPGGLFTAWHLAAKLGDACQITVYEASERLGGKIVTGQFPGIGPYEAGVAEIYDYSRLGPDPLHDLIIGELGLDVKYIEGGPCVLGGKVILNVDDLAAEFGERARDEAKSFRQKCAGLMAPADFYLSIAKVDNASAWMNISGAALLEREIDDDDARRYLRVMAHSDVAAGPHLTNGLNFAKNVLMDVDGYMDIFSVIGGNEQIVDRLVDELDADLRPNSNVTAVQPRADGSYSLEMQVHGAAQVEIADFVVVALPLSALSTIHWRSEPLQSAIDRHTSHFDRPGHYLRATLLFERPFWRDQLPADWFMLDAFDGCCVYDESARHDYGAYGCLAFLIAGNAALALANVSDERIEQLCLEALPSCLAEGRDLILDRRIHRWMASVNAIPGGVPVRPREQNHRPDPTRLPGLVMVGDYIFDATLNGVLDSADAATDILLAEVLRRRRAESQIHIDPFRAAHWTSVTATEDVLDRLLPAECLRDILAVAWGLQPGAKILHVGAASGRMVGALRALGFEAIGVESNRLAVLAMKDELKPYVYFNELTDLPFEDRAFDAVVETGLCRLPSNEACQAIEEIKRVSRLGFILGSVTTDLPIDLIERHDLLNGVATLGSRWDWSEKLYAAGYVHALTDTLQLDDAWKMAEAAGSGPGQWYEDAESLLYCVYQPAQPESAMRDDADADELPYVTAHIVMAASG